MYPLVFSENKPSAWLEASGTQWLCVFSWWVKLRFRGERRISSIPKQPGSKVDGLFCSTMFMKLEQNPELLTERRFSDIRKDCLTVELLSLLFR